VSRNGQADHPQKPKEAVHHIDFFFYFSLFNTSHFVAGMTDYATAHTLVSA
jgi:hypothetical protein